MSHVQGGPSGDPQWGVGGGAPTPDWSALAADAERDRRRRRRLVVGGGALATVLVGTAVALAIVHQGNGGGSDAPADRGGNALDAAGGSSPDAQPEPTFSETSLPPPPKPREFVTDPEKDLAPFTSDSFFAGETMRVEDREYLRGAADTAEGTEACAATAGPGPATALTEHGCLALVRATYTAEGVAVTVGVAQFPGEEEAAAAKEAAEGPITPLIGEGAAAFCQRGGCRTTRSQLGRYVYFTIAGNLDNTPDSGEDTPAQRAARDGNEHAYTRIVQRGESQASASAEALIAERQRAAGGGADEEPEPGATDGD
ncbi:hypothetical protein GCM10027160_42650 [Streptomyces calidiresistens]|uniref:Uncharacterized protein n=1 Tax=Streptomyces calidiresistens TaxID=1485586 RepID=A0A7W3T393_9ACTN|nr:hypothetical protein [Streptomyces calidiresistens]MBB0229993.1 hypothetical protein [Streptomyces calidiresistens]